MHVHCQSVISLGLMPWTSWDHGAAIRTGVKELAELLPEHVLNMLIYNDVGILTQYLQEIRFVLQKILYHGSDAGFDEVWTESAWQ